MTNYHAIEKLAHQQHAETLLLLDAERLVRKAQFSTHTDFTTRLSKFLGFINRSMSRKERKIAHA